MHAPQYVSPKRQFELRQAAWKPNMDIGVETPPYRVDGVDGWSTCHQTLENCVEMQCFDMEAWQDVVQE